MAITKSDTYTSSNVQKEYYSDVPNNFAINPITQELGVVTQERAVTQSIKNLIFTQRGFRFFQPLVGCGIFNELFEINDSITDAAITKYIETTITNDEPRAELRSVNVVSEGYEINITIVYNLINNADPITINLTLIRVR